MAAPDPLFCEEIDKEEAHALHQVCMGEATPHQQQLAIATIVNKFARTNDLSYIPGSFDGSAILAGRSYVGYKILKYANKVT